MPTEDDKVGEELEGGLTSITEDTALYRKMGLLLRGQSL